MGLRLISFSLTFLAPYAARVAFEYWSMNALRMLRIIMYDGRCISYIRLLCRSFISGYRLLSVLIFSPAHSAWPLGPVHGVPAQGRKRHRFICFATTLAVQ